ncbi:hypothetical protein ACFYTS_07410 [Nocardia sp. NPDC004151]|uniref:hypothetical protein n=1 Tax=Nocardia sp. NPDC004151 TaxID=3364304 RepID=UPI0036A708EC
MSLVAEHDGLGFARQRDSDPDAREFLEYLDNQLRALNELLAIEGLPALTKPAVPGTAKTRDRTTEIGYSYLHHLRSAYARARVYPDQPLTLVETEEDHRVADEAVEELGYTLASHLICHSDCEGYYLPIEFDEPLYEEDLDIDGGLVGSTPALLRELVYVAPYLDINVVDDVLSDAEIARIYAEQGDYTDNPHPFYRERESWIHLFEVARVSIANGSVMGFCG